MRELTDETVAVSVVVPCYRCAATIERAVRSVAEQLLRPAELILIEDGSGDDTLSALRKLAKVYPAGWIRIVALNVNEGAATARNTGWSAARHPYVAFLDADDAWHPEKIKIQHKFMQEHPHIAVCGHRHRILDRINPTIAAVGDQPVIATELGKRAVLLSNQFVTPSVMLRRDLPFRFIPARRHMEDHLLWMQAICGGFRTVRLEIELAWIFKTSFGVRGLSSDMWAMERGSLSNYWLLGQGGCISRASAIGLMGYSFLKYIRRLIIVMGRSMFRSVNSKKSTDSRK